MPEFELVGCTEPHLGLATTKQLIDELATRAEEAQTDGESWPDRSSPINSDLRTMNLPLIEAVAQREHALMFPPDEKFCECPWPNLGKRTHWDMPRCSECRLMVDPKILNAIRDAMTSAEVAAIFEVSEEVINIGGEQICTCPEGVLKPYFDPRISPFARCRRCNKPSTIKE